MAAQVICIIKAASNLKDEEALDHRGEECLRRLYRHAQRELQPHPSVVEVAAKAQAEALENKPKRRKKRVQ